MKKTVISKIVNSQRDNCYRVLIISIILISAWYVEWLFLNQLLNI